MDFVVEELSWGFVVSRTPTAPDGKWTFVIAPELRLENEQLVQFCRVRMSADEGSSAKDVFVLTPGTVPTDEVSREAVDRALLRDNVGASVVTPRASRVGYAELRAPPAEHEVVAAAVAVSMASGAWDESDPILISVGSTRFRVQATFDGGRWHATVHAG